MSNRVGHGSVCTLRVRKIDNDIRVRGKLTGQWSLNLVQSSKYACVLSEARVLGRFNGAGNFEFVILTTQSKQAMAHATTSPMNDQLDLI